MGELLWGQVRPEPEPEPPVFSPNRIRAKCLSAESKQRVEGIKGGFMRFVATNCRLSHLRCSKVAITTIAMVMSSAHESSATPVYDHRGKTNPACRFHCGYTHALKHTHTGLESMHHIGEKKVEA